MPSTPDGARRLRSRVGTRALRLVALFALALLVWAPSGPGSTAAADDSPDDLLAQARIDQLTKGDSRAALLKYQEVLGLPSLDPRHRGWALWGAAECHAALGEWDQAQSRWEEILADERLPVDVRKSAEEARARRAEARRAETPPPPSERSAAEEHEAAEKRRRAEVEGLLERARAAYDARKFDDAYEHVASALERDPENPKAQDLLERVQQERPDRGALLRSLLQWFQTVRSETFQRVRTRLHDLEEVAQKRQKEGDLRGADLAFREAIALVDRSEFRAELETERGHLIFWLGQVDADGEDRGLEFAPEPSAPAGPPAEMGLKGRFYALLSETFSGRDAGADPIRFHEFAPAPVQDGLPHRALGPNAFASRAIAVEQAASPLTRARWAERWIRRHVGGEWPSRVAPAVSPPGRRPGVVAAPRLLERLEDTLFVQHAEAAQREIDSLRTSFADVPRPLQVDVSVYGTGAGGTVRIASALRLPAPPLRDPGLSAVAGGALIEECRRDLEHLEMVTLLGHAQLRLTGDVAARLEVTERTEAHPLHSGLPNPLVPPLTLLGLDPARYGLFLDVYAEDQPNAGKPPRAGALSLSARVRLPLPSVVVHKPDRGGLWTRLPKFSETTVESDERLAHSATLVLFGLPNPFVDSADRYPDLVLLLGLRPMSPDGRNAPVPDTPVRISTTPESQDLPLGSLATEVVDDMVIDGWPEDRSAAQPVPDAVARRARDEYLAGLLAGRARLLGATGSNPVRVHDGLASAALGTDERVRLQAAAVLLASQETALYDVDVRAVEADAQTADTWAKREGVTPLPDATATAPAGGKAGTAFLVPAALAPLLDVELSRLEKAPSLYTLVGHHVARATQQIVLRRLATQSITRQMRVARSAVDGKQRFVPVPGMAEEGLIVQVRPWLEDEGRRVVSVRARAARLRVVEGVALKGVETPGLLVDVPRWHPFQDKAAAAALADGDVLLLRLPIPEDSSRALLVRVSTRKVQ